MERAPNAGLADVARALRLRKGYSQAEVAHRYGVVQAHISRLESGAADARAYFDFLTLLSNSGERAGGVARARRKGTAMIAQPEYEVLDNAKDVFRARKALLKAVKESASDFGTLTLGHQGSTFIAKAYYVERYDVWTAFDDGSYETLWNTYGIGNPFDGRPRDMVCHLTVPSEGINRRAGAVYARDADGDLFVFHRGKIGGGRQGLGKSAFWDRAEVKSAQVQDGDRVTDMALVGRIGSKSFLRDVATFVREVKRVKDEIVSD
jgi:transcriptional regulator with XRE-family HTH domain